MPSIQARFNKYKDQYRCGLPDCGALLGIGEIKEGSIEIKCGCGVLNVCSPVKRENISSNIAAEQHKPEGRLNGEQLNKSTKKKQ